MSNYAENSIAWETRRLFIRKATRIFIDAQAYLGKLVQTGFLREVTGFARNRIYQADEIMQVYL